MIINPYIITVLPPTNTVLPYISTPNGKDEWGQVFTCSTGTWTGSGISYTYQWKKNGSNIGGETNSTYTPAESDSQDYLECVVTATNGGGAVSATSSLVYVWEAQVSQDVILDLNPYRIKTLMQQFPDVDHVTADGDFVGTIYDMSCVGKKWRIASGGASRMTLGSGITGMANYLISVGTGFYEQDGLSLYKILHSTNPVYSFGVKFKMGASSNGVAKIILNSLGSSGNSANIGIALDRTTGNKLQWRVAKGTSGTYGVNKTTSATINEASNVVVVIIVANGTGTGAGTLYITQNVGEVGEATTSESFDIVGGSSSNANGTNFLFGTGNGLKLGRLKLWTSVISSGDRAAFVADNPARSTKFWQVKKQHYDFSDGSKIYSDVAETTLAVNNDPIRAVLNQVTIPTGYGTRKLTTAGSGTSPDFKTNYQNGLSVALFDRPSNDNFVLSENAFEDGRQGMFMYFVGLQNLDPNLGSRFTFGNIYAVRTGSAYNGALGVGVPYLLKHGEGAVPGEACVAVNLNGPDGFCMARDGGVSNDYNQSGTKYSKVWTVNFQITDIGKDDGAGWNMKGPMYEVELWWGFADDAMIANRNNRKWVRKWGV